MTTAGKLLLGMAAFLLVASAGYWFLSYEEAGSVLLLLSSGLVLIAGGYLVVSTRGAPKPASASEAGGGGAGHGTEGDDHPYLPHASVWPLGVGAGSVVLANGLALGLWAVVPGLIIVAGSIVGYARQSRNRD